MRRCIGALLILLLHGGVARAAEFKYDMWEAWNSFEKGSSVSLELKSNGRTMMKNTTTIVGKGDEAITVEDAIERSGGGKDVLQRKIAKPPASVTPPECAMCKKPHKAPESKESEEKLKVADRELECHVVETTCYGCDAQVMSTTRIWYSDEVPGWIVQMVSKGTGFETTQVCTGFRVAK